MPEILTNLSLEEFKNQLNILPKDDIIIVRFTAEWCQPCQKINEECNDFFNNCNKRIHPIIIDIDESLELYITMKRHKMINGIPVLMAYYGNDKKDHWYVPSDSVIGGNKKDLAMFFNNCELHITKIYS